MTDSLFTALAENGLTSLKLQYDWRSGEHTLLAAKEWEPDLNFADYRKNFYAESLLTTNVKYLNTDEVIALFESTGTSQHLEKVLDLLRQGRHFGIEAYYHAGKDIRFMCHQHSRKQGASNKRQATLAGGIRRHPHSEDELHVIVDGLNLGRAMSFKNIAAELDFGGCKTTVQMDELQLDDLEALGFLAFAIDRSRTMTGPDMNFPTAMSDVINEYFSLQFTNGPSSPLGESGGPTAYGTFLALKEAVKFTEGATTLADKKIIVTGLGAVGWHLAHLLYEEAETVVVSDLNTDRVEQFLLQHPGSLAIPVSEAMTAEADILCPSAIGGILDEETISNLNVRYVWGPANNQLKATNQAEEERLSRLLADRGIVFQVEWWHNTAGVMCGAEEYINGKNASIDSLNRRIEQTIPRKTRENLIEAAELGLTPTENAYRICASTIYGENSFAAV